MDREGLLKILRGYYYLTPLWFLLEITMMPGLRAGLFTDSTGGAAGFYAVEAAIGAAFWFKLPVANPAALGENILYLIAGFKYILFEPIDMALALDGGGGSGDYAARGEAYVTALPGIFASCAQVVTRIYELLYRKSPV